MQKWNAQWMQTPTSEEGSIVKREWWNAWESELYHLLVILYKATILLFLKKKLLTIQLYLLGVFLDLQPDSPDCIILLDAQKGRWDFPELKSIAIRIYNTGKPIWYLIEAKASGTPLTHELRRIRHTCC